MLFIKENQKSGQITEAHDKKRARTDKRLPERRGKRIRKQKQRHDERTHVLGCLGERVLESRNRGKDLAERDQNVAV